MLEIIRYTADKANEWNAFVKVSRNGTFLFLRDYMDYHSDRFADHSLMFYNKGNLCALLPANVEDDTLISHQGLTYGGIITKMNATTQLVVSLIQTLNKYLHNIGLKRVVYKCVPWIYHRYPSEEDLYAIHNICDAQLTSRHISSAIYLPLRPRLAESRKSGLRKAISANLTIEECPLSKLEEFWKILHDNLENKYNTRPVHSIEEITMLANRFPSNIKLFAVFDTNEMLGGTLIYVTSQVIHTQYISASPKGKETGALDLLFDKLLKYDWNGAHYFEFGRSSTGDGHQLNSPLLFQKEGFGGRGVVYDTYEWTI